MTAKISALLLLFCFIAVSPVWAQRRITQAEYFWNADPGQGNGIALQATDGNLDNVIESLFKTGIATPATGLQRFNIRVKDNANNWGPVFSVVVSVESKPLITGRIIQIAQAEYFWDADPGAGNGTALLALDGNLDNALETLFKNGIPSPAVGLHTFNVRVKDATGNWGPVFKSAVTVEANPVVLQKEISIVQGEGYWDTDPGQGNGQTFVALDGSFDNAIESLVKSVKTNALTTGAHTFFVRVKDRAGNWGPSFGSAIYIDVSQVPVTAQINGPATYCSGSTPANATYNVAIQPGVTSYSWSITGGAIVSGQSTNAVSVNWNAAGPYSLTITECNSFGCSVPYTLDIMPVTPPVVAFSGLSTSDYCVSASAATLTGSPAGGTFSGPGISGSTFNPAAAGIGTHTISYVYSNGTCSNSVSETVTVKALPTVSFSGLAGNYCVSSGTVTLTGSPAGGTFSGPGISGATFNPATAGVGTHTISYTYSDGQCSNTSTKSVSVTAEPVVSFTGLNTAYCANAAAVTLTGNPAGGSFSGPGISGNSFSAATAGTGTHTITYTYASGGCTKSATRTVTVNALPAVNFTGLGTEYCANGAAVTLSGTPAGGTFSGPGMTGSSFNPANAGAGNHIITYTYSNGTCSNTKTQAVTVNALPAVSFSGLGSSYCVTAGAVALTGSPAGGVFSGAGISGGSFNPASAGTGTHTVTYTYSDGQCTGTSTRTVVVNAEPVITFSGLNTAYCTNAAAVNLTGSPAGGTFSGPGVSGVSFNPGTAGAGTHTITYTYASGGCTKTFSRNVTVNALPAVGFTGLNADYCVNASSAPLSGSPAGGTFSGPGISGASFNPATAGAGTHTITYTYSNGNCSNAVSQAVTVKALPTATISGLSSSYCVGTPAVSLTGAPAGGTFSGPGVSGNSFNPATAGTGTHTITYSVTVNGCTGTVTQPVTVTPATSTSFTGLAPKYGLTYSPSALTGNPAGGTFSGPGISGNTFNPAAAGLGTHTITYTLTSSACATPSSQTVTVYPMPVVSFSGLGSSVCSNAPNRTLTGSPAGGTFSGPGVSGNIFNPATAGTGTHTVTYTYTDGNGITNSVQQSVTVNAAPVMNITGLAASYCRNAGAVTLTGTPAGGTFTINGTPATTFNPASLSVGNHTVVYTFTSAAGCSGTVSQAVTVVATPATVAGSNQTVCANAAAFALTGYSPAGGTWSGNGVSATGTFTPSGSLTGTHTLTYTVTQGGCTSTATKTITVQAAPAVTMSGFNASLTYCITDGAVTLSGSPAGGTFSGNGISGNAFNPGTAGVGSHTVTYQYTDANNCSGQAVQVVNVGVCTNVKNEKPLQYVAVIPNPNKAAFDISFTLDQTEKLDIKVVNSIGQVIWKSAYNATSGEHKLPVALPKAASGVYFLQMQSEKSLRVLRFIVE